MWPHQPIRYSMGHATPRDASTHRRDPATLSQEALHYGAGGGRELVPAVPSEATIPSTGTSTRATASPSQCTTGVFPAHRLHRGTKPCLSNPTALNSAS